MTQNVLYTYVFSVIAFWNQHDVVLLHGEFSINVIAHANCTTYLASYT